MKHKSLLVTLVALIPLLLGATATIQPPSKRVNGDVLLATEISKSEVFCRLGTAPAVLKATMAGVATTATWTETVAGTYTCYATTTDTEGRVSAPTNTVNFTVGRCEVSDCRPLPPSLISLTLN